MAQCPPKYASAPTPSSILRRTPNFFTSSPTSNDGAVSLLRLKYCSLRQEFCFVAILTIAVILPETTLTVMSKQ